MAYIAIVATDNNRVAKFAEYTTREHANQHVARYGGFVFHNENEWDVMSLWIDGETVTNVTKSPPIDDIKAEAQRRIYAIMKDFEQDNAQAWALSMLRKVQLGGTMTQAELAKESELNAAWAAIQNIRAKSNAIEAMDPIPQGYTDDRYWTE